MSLRTNMIWYLATYSISFPVTLPLAHCPPSTLAPLQFLKHNKKSISGPLYLLFPLLRNILMAYSLHVSLLKCHFLREAFQDHTPESTMHHPLI